MYLPLFHNYLPGNAILWSVGIVYPSCGDQRFLLDVLLYCFALLKIKFFFLLPGHERFACMYIYTMCRPAARGSTQMHGSPGAGGTGQCELLAGGCQESDWGLLEEPPVPLTTELSLSSPVL